MLEAIRLCEEVAGRELAWTLEEQARIGDHRWWVSDLAEFRRDYPEWRLTYGIEEIIHEIHDHNAERWAVAR
jgi:CDP-paratose 2-epimerase